MGYSTHEEERGTAAGVEIGREERGGDGVPWTYRGVEEPRKMRGGVGGLEYPGKKRGWSTEDEGST